MLTASRWARAASLAVCLALASSCAPAARLELPSGPGAAFDAFADAFSEASRYCSSVSTLTADLSISGRAAGERLRGHVLAGLQEPGRLRLEGVAPFGAPAFILVASAGRATLLLPRDRRVLSDAAPEDILEAIAGIPLGPDDLRAMLAGCLVAERRPVSGRLYANGWARVDLEGGSAAYLKMEPGGWRIAAGTIEGISVEYRELANEQPREVTVRSNASAGADTVLRVTINEPEINRSLDLQAFSVRVPADAEPLTLDDVRRGGPLASGKK